MKNKCCSGRFKPETGRKLGASLSRNVSAGARCGMEYARRIGGTRRPGSRLAAGLSVFIIEKKRTRAHAYAPAYYIMCAEKMETKKSLKANPVQNMPERG